MDLMQNYCIQIRAHLRGLGTQLSKMFLGNIKSTFCFSVRDIQGHFTIDFPMGVFYNQRLQQRYSTSAGVGFTVCVKNSTLAVH